MYHWEHLWFDTETTEIKWLYIGGDFLGVCEAVALVAGLVDSLDGVELTSDFAILSAEPEQSKI